LLAAYGFAFCHDYDDAGRKAGYAWTHLRTCLPHLAALVSDNSRIWPQLAADHRFDARDRAKLFCLYLPVDPTLAGRVGPQVAHHLAQGPRRRHKALWAGRFGAQKGLDAVLAIARALPELDFRLYGGEAEQLPEMPPANLSAGGGFSEFADLPLHEATLFLHTSRWDGLPNVLLEAGAAGLPIVAPDVGGVADLVDETTGWLVAPDSGPEVYAAAIRALLADPQATLARRDRMSARIAARHAPATFAAEVARLGAFAEQNRAEMGASPA
jgi:glycosyltransferase involved in cell wall biosynthesis